MGIRIGDRSPDFTHGYANDLPIEWSNFWLFIGLTFVFLVAAALLARIKIGSFPANPIYWHAWVITQSNPVTFRGYPKKYHPFIFFWAASVMCFFVALLVLFNILSNA